MVRAPACHVGSCGFKPRLPRSNYLICFIITLILQACYSNTQDDFREEGQAIVKSLSAHLEKIRVSEQLASEGPAIKEAFKQLAELMSVAHKSYARDPDSYLKEFTPLELVESERLRQEISRISRLEGGTKLISECRAEALKVLNREKLIE